MADRSRLGVSPIIATLLLIVIAVAGSVITYAFVSGFIGGASPEVPRATIAVDSIASNESHVLIYVRNTGNALANVDRVYVEQGGSLVMSEDVDAAIPPGMVQLVPIFKGALGSATAYTFKVVCEGTAMPAVYSSSIGGGTTPMPTDATPPVCTELGGNTTVAGGSCFFSSTWSDNVGLSGSIFSTNLTGEWVNSSWSAFVGNVGSAVATLPPAGTVVGYRFYANDTSNNWGGSSIQSLTTGEYVWVQQNTTVITGYTDPIMAPSGSWLNPSYAYADGGNYASTPTTLVTQQWGTYGFDLPSNTTEISNIIIRYDAWSSSAVAEYTEMYAMINEAGTGWRDYNISLNLGVPAEAVAEIVLANAAASAARTLGVRTDGSSLDRYVKLAEAESGGNRTATMLVKVASNGLIETYCSSTSGANFILIGYWAGVDYTELIASWTAGTASAWTDYDLTATGVPASSVAQIFIGNRDNDAAQTGGVRNPASSLSRYASIHEAESSSTEYTDYGGYTTFVKDRKSVV